MWAPMMPPSPAVAPSAARPKQLCVNSLAHGVVQAGACNAREAQV